MIRMVVNIMPASCPSALRSSCCALGVQGCGVFQDVGFENNMLKPLAHISFRCEVPTPSVVEGQSTVMFKPRILKHHIPELPSACMSLDSASRASSSPSSSCESSTSRSAFAESFGFVSMWLISMFII